MDYMQLSKPLELVCFHNKQAYLIDIGCYLTQISRWNTTPYQQAGSHAIWAEWLTQWLTQYITRRYSKSVNSDAWYIKQKTESKGFALCVNVHTRISMTPTRWDESQDNWEECWMSTLRGMHFEYQALHTYTSVFSFSRIFKGYMFLCDSCVTRSPSLAGKPYNTSQPTTRKRKHLTSGLRKLSVPTREQNCVSEAR